MCSACSMFFVARFSWWLEVCAVVVDVDDGVVFCVDVDVVVVLRAVDRRTRRRTTT